MAGLLVVLVVVAWWVTGESREGRGVPADTTPVASPAPPDLPLPSFEVESPAASAAEPVASAQLVEAPASPLLATPASGGLAIVVVDTSNRPVAGARVEIWAEADDEWEEGLSPRATLETDSTGRCSLPPEDDQAVALATRAGLGSSGYIDFWHLRHLATLSGEAVMRLEPRSKLRGLVVEPDDRPAADVEVRFWPFGGGAHDGRIPRPLHTDSEGRFSVEVDASAMLGLFAWDGTRSSNSVRYMTEPGGEREVLLRMPGDWTVAGIVFSRRSEPLANVKVLIWRIVPEWFLPRVEQPDFLPNSWFEETTTGADGRFLFRVRERLGYTVIAHVPGELPTPAADVVIDAAHDHAFVELRPPEPSFIAGHVVDREGTPLAGVTVHALNATMWSPSDRHYEPWPKDRWGEGGSARTDALGAFRIEGLHPDGWYRVGPRSAARYMRKPDPATDVHAGRTDVVIVQDAQPPESSSVTFAVHATGGAGLLPDATVTVYRLFDEGELVAQLKSEILPDGRWSFAGLAVNDRYGAMVKAPGLAAVDVDPWIAAPGTLEHDVALPRPATLDVEARDVRGESAPWVAILIAPVKDRREWRGRSGRDADALGRARFADIDPGPYRITVRQAGRETTRDVDMGDGETRLVQVVLPD